MPAVRLRRADVVRVVAIRFPIERSVRPPEADLAARSIYGPIGSHTIGTASQFATAGIPPPFDRLRMAECQPALIVKWRVQLCGTGPCARLVARYPD